MRLSIRPEDFIAHLFRLLSALMIFGAGHAHALDPRAPLAQYSRQVWQTENGLPQNTVRSVVQTEDGYIWVATREGLARFDGNGFTVFDKQNTPQLKSNDIRHLLPALKNGLWVSTSAGLTSLYHGEWKTYTVREGLPADEVEVTYEGRDGALWVGTSAGLARFREGKFETFTTQDGLMSGSVHSIFEDAGDALWVGTTDGLSRFEGGKFTNYAARGGFPGGGVDAIRRDAGGRLWFGTLDGLVSYQDGRFTSYTVKDGLPNNRVIALHADKEGALWVGTAGGLSRLGRDGRFETHAAGEVLSSGIVLALFEDAEGSLWVGTESGGLHQLRDKKFNTYTTREGLPSDLVKAVYEDRRGQVWVGTYGGGLSLIGRDGAMTTYTTADGLASNIILALFDDADGNLWVGTPDGLSRLREGRFTTYTSADGLAHDFVRSIYADRAGALWVGTRGGLTRMKDGAFNIYTTRDGLADDFVGTIYEDAAGHLWAGTLGGLSRFSEGKFTTYTTRDGLSDNVVISLLGDAEGRLWIGTNGGGLNILREGKFSSVSTQDGLPNDTIYRILEDGAGNLWMSCNKGIFRVAKAELDDFAGGRTRSLSPVVYGTADGMTTRECSGGGHPSGWRGADGRLWFSTIKGLAVIDPAGVRSNTQPPPTVIEQVSVDGEPLGARLRAELAPGKSRFDFHYAGLSFVAPEKVRYRYRLKGFDEDWVEGGARRVAYYTNLGPGDYRFEVIACNNDGVWSRAPASFDFTLQPHFYRTPWFYALCALAVAFVAAQLYFMRVRQMKARFAAVLAERNRIAREIHDNLAQEILGASVQLELVARLMPRSTEAARTHLDRARALVRSSIAEARRYVWDLRSQSLDDRDLPTALAEMTRRLTAESRVQTQFEVSGTFRPLPPQVENNLLRIGQEAVNNAVRHAGAGVITVNLSFDAESVRLSVRDDGRGFDPHNGGGDGHFGIVGMRERAAEMGGTVSVNSRPGEGTEVSVGVPIED
ncbi:MAG TPA: two-component regulator propeller domain-containing protein [Pyrinomonadaceae bacterium]|nr:two-component regulator propeller domain-containing protein [Pyrinomonadaceae bacterium]